MFIPDRLKEFNNHSMTIKWFPSFKNRCQDKNKKHGISVKQDLKWQIGLYNILKKIKRK